MVALAKRLPLTELLRCQDQLIRRDQVIAAGVSRAALDGHIRHGRWLRVLPAMYLTDPATPDSAAMLAWRRRIRAVWMWAGDDAVITGPAAAAWAGYLEDLTPATPIGVLVPPRRRMSSQPGIRVVRGVIDQRDTTSRDGILITSACRSAVDLAAQGCNDLLDRMSQNNWLRPAPLQRALNRGAHRRGWGSARVAVRESLRNPHSEAERVTHRALLAAGISDWRANAELIINGRTVRPDLTFDEVKLIVEIDGFAYHGDRDAFEGDRRRQNVLTAAGWTVLRFTWRQVHDDPAAMVAQIKQTRRLLLSRLRVE